MSSNFFISPQNQRFCKLSDLDGTLYKTQKIFSFCILGSSDWCGIPGEKHLLLISERNSRLFITSNTLYSQATRSWGYVESKQAETTRLFAGTWRHMGAGENEGLYDGYENNASFKVPTVVVETRNEVRLSTSRTNTLPSANRIYVSVSASSIRPALRGCGELNRITHH